MIPIKRQDFIIKCHNVAANYIKKIRNSLSRTSAYLDLNYVETTINELSLYAALIRQDCLNDMRMFREDVAIARDLQESTESFGDYCFDAIADAYRATNNCLVANNELVHDLQDEFQDYIDISVSSNFIGFGTFENGTKLELTNFGRMTGVGVTFDIFVKSKDIVLPRTNIGNKQMQSFVKTAEIIRALEDSSTILQKIDKWSELVNDQLAQVKLAALTPWFFTWLALSEDTKLDLEFYKVNVETYCTLQYQKTKFIEILQKRGHTAKKEYRNENVVLLLDYLNNRNFDIIG